MLYQANNTAKQARLSYTARRTSLRKRIAWWNDHWPLEGAGAWVLKARAAAEKA